MRKVLAISDLHAGHCVGLTPPSWQKHSDFEDIQSKLWGFYRDTVKRIGGVDVLLVLGDCIDGDGARSGGSELIERDQLIQCEIAADAINAIKADEIVMVRGTPYHVNSEEGTDFEDQVAKCVGATKIGDHEWVDVNGVVFDIKHKVGSSGIPHGRHTAVAKENLWNMIWADMEVNPRGNVFLRGHVHYYNYCGGPDWLGMTLPALQGMGSKFGARQCSGTVDFGMVEFTVDKGAYTWKPHLLKLRGYQEAIKL